eukprot:CAMPEP_0172939412 /NCGR_PEP_ID=MMETSP1075-20121228/223518_1 /TAXON_ID=2916 /ORGANISM="Ceratium fusus, Strain PA161109" /LENGTH=290 /DNA_ID=CAMNT_0013800803 /DNA_START=1 /DNA_END=873 /DNA_ORIENTATION=+
MVSSPLPSQVQDPWLKCVSNAAAAAEQHRKLFPSLFFRPRTSLRIMLDHIGDTQLLLLAALQLIHCAARELEAQATQKRKLCGREKLVARRNVWEAPHQPAVAGRVTTVTTAPSKLVSEQIRNPIFCAVWLGLYAIHNFVSRDALAANILVTVDQAHSHEKYFTALLLPNLVGRTPAVIKHANPEVCFFGIPVVFHQGFDTSQGICGVKEGAESLVPGHLHGVAEANHLHAEVSSCVCDQHPTAPPPQQRDETQALDEASIVEEDLQRWLRRRVVVHQCCVYVSNQRGAE